MSTKRGTRQKATSAFAQPLPEASPDVAHNYELLVVRESDASDFLQFEDMAYKTISMIISTHPELETLLNNPLDPIRNPTKWNTIVETRPGARSFQFLIGGTIVLYHLGSAAKVNDNEDINFFTEVLIRLITTYKIRSIYAFGINRLVRDQKNASKIAVELQELGALVTMSNFNIDFTTVLGSTAWNFLGMVAEQERQGIVERNRLGRIAVARRNEWPHRKEVVPLGYILQGRTIVPDPKQRELVGKILALMADESLSMRQFANELGTLKVKRPRVSAYYGEDATVDQVRHPKDLFESFINLLSLYEFGRYEMPLPNPTKHATLFGSLPVHRPDPQSDGFVILTYEFGLPPGGWADPLVFEAIRVKLDNNKRFTNGTRERRAFGGRALYEVDGTIFQLDSNSPESYRLRRHRFAPGSPTGPGGQVLQSEEIETIATVTASVLHKSVIEGIVNAVSSAAGVSGKVIPHALRVQHGPEETLQRTIDFHQRRATRAREEAIRSSEPATAAAFRKEAEWAEHQLQLLRDATPGEGLATTSSSVTLDHEAIIRNLAKIALTEAKVPGDVYAACMRLIPTIELSPTCDPSTIAWSTMVHLPTVEGSVLELGPITGTVRSRQFRPASGAIEQRSEAVFGPYGEGRSIEETAKSLDVRPDYAWRAVRHELQAAGFHEGALSRLRSAPVPELRILVARAAKAGIVDRFQTLGSAERAAFLEAEHCVPDGCDSSWAAHALSSYLQTLGTKGEWSMSNRLGQRAVDLVNERGGTLSIGELCEAIGGEVDSHHQLINGVLGRGKSGVSMVLKADGEIKASGGLLFDQAATLRVVGCPHCGGTTMLVLRVTEVPRQLLCETCHRMPGAPFEFPPGYFTLERGRDSFAQSLTANDPADPRDPCRKFERRGPIDEETTAKIVSDYKDGLVISGSGGILKRYSINTERLMTIIDTAGVEHRQPFRPRIKTKGSRTVRASTSAPEGDSTDDPTAT